jgi:hypothetical protein
VTEQSHMRYGRCLHMCNYRAVLVAGQTGVSRAAFDQATPRW